jgi:hypothetical protein
LIKKINNSNTVRLWAALLSDEGGPLLKRKREMENKTAKTLSREEAFDQKYSQDGEHLAFDV